MTTVHSLILATLLAASPAIPQTPRAAPAPADVKPGSITCEECPYPFPSSCPAAVAVWPGRAHRLHGRRCAGHAQRPHRDDFSRP
ncbi:MAG: hypothetical protein WKG07_46510 [Hymenobacter sp.]